MFQRPDDPSLFSSKISKKKAIDIPEIPLDVARYEKSLAIRGICELTEHKSHIQLERMHAPDNVPGSGFGKAKFRELVTQSIKLNIPGKISTSVSTKFGTPHLFYLYMGMAPDPQIWHQKESYLKIHHGTKGENIINALCECKEWTIEELTRSKLNLAYIKGILADELQVREDDLTLADIIKNRILFFELKGKKMEYGFVQRLLDILSEDPKNKFPDTRRLDAIDMHLTEAGFERWKYVIENNLEFVCFNHFEHLNLTSEQQKQVEEILAKRTTVSASP